MIIPEYIQSLRDRAKELTTIAKQPKNWYYIQVPQPTRIAQSVRAPR